MAIKAIVDKLEDVDEKYRDLYTEKNGKFELTGVEGFKTQADIDRIQTSLVKERKDHKETREKFAPFAELDLADIQAKLDKYPELEAAAAGNLDEKKIEGIVEGRLKAKTAPLERDLQKLRKDLSEREELIKGFTAKERTRTIHDAVREAVGKAQGFNASAMEDALMFADRMFDIDEHGKVITKDGVGVTPGIEATVWLTEMQQKKPHWWGVTGGGGAGGNRGGGGGGANNPWSAEHWNMTEQGKIFKENPTRAEQLAKSAGTRVGGMRPAKSK